MRNDINILATAALVLAVTFVTSCGERQRTTSGLAAGDSRATPSQLSQTSGGGEPGLDLGEDWQSPAARSAAAPRQAAPSTSRPHRASQQRASGRPQPTAHTSGAGGGGWSIVLNTFSGDSHEQSAKTMVAHLPSIAPEITGAFVRSTASGSMVLYGSYAGPDDTRARADLDRIKSITHHDIPVFPRAFLSRAGTVAAREADHPHSLRTARQLHPNVNPLYTLQIAAWSDFDTGQLAPDEIRRKAEAYAQQLRSQGYEAYFHHDDNTRLSVVTVGLFDRTAYDVEAGDVSPELRDLRRRFPHHLVNGEPLEELIDRRNPRKGTRPQESRLVLVPRR